MCCFTHDVNGYKHEKIARKNDFFALHNETEGVYYDMKGGQYHIK